MNIFVTGATGCVGTHLVNKLITDRHRVYALTRPSSDTSALKPHAKLEFVHGNLLDVDVFTEKVPKIDIVIHCAARTGFAKKADQSYAGYDDNVVGTKNLLEYFKDKRLKQFVFISSLSAMGDIYDGQRDETHSPQPDSDYGQSKLACEKLIEDYATQNGFAFTHLRPGLIYGPYDRGGMRTMIEYIDKGKFVIFGNGQNRKSMICVHNLVEGIRCVLNHKKAFNQTFIITDGRSRSLKEICSQITSLLNRSQPVRKIPQALSLVLGVLGDMINILPRINFPVTSKALKKMASSNTYNINKIQSLVDYQPVIDLHEGLKEEVQWFKSGGGRG